MNKKNRIKAYKRMLEAWKAGEKDTSLGFCYWVAMQYGQSSLNGFPELLKQKPTRNYRSVNPVIGAPFDTGYWWKQGSRKPRILALERAIAECRRTHESNIRTIIGWATKRYSLERDDVSDINTLIWSYDYRLTQRNLKLRIGLNGTYSKPAKILLAFMKSRKSKELFVSN